MRLDHMQTSDQHILEGVTTIITTKISIICNNNYYMASSVSGQDEPNRALWLASTRVGKIVASCPLGTTRCVPQEKFLRKPYNKSFIDQDRSVKMVGYWLVVWCVQDRDGVEAHKHAKKERGQYSAILTEQAWSITHIIVRPNVLIKATRHVKEKLVLKSIS